MVKRSVVQARAAAAVSLLLFLTHTRRTSRGQSNPGAGGGAGGRARDAEVGELDALMCHLLLGRRVADGPRQEARRAQVLHHGALHGPGLRLFVVCRL